ncbi:MAG: hypothetical protein NT003_01430 [Candidatus Magasanikbacteria bacterium]|nr:hypothetical protein [Candidatus Magasanikbacteria bacterium]
MSRIIQVAPLVALPTHAAIFDYLWEMKIIPQRGMIVEIPFRRKKVFGVILDIKDASQFKLRAIDEQVPHFFLISREIDFLKSLSSHTSESVGSLAQHMLPPFTKKNLTTLENRTERPSYKNEQSKLQYAWYGSPTVKLHALDSLISGHSGPVAIIAPSNADAERLVQQIQVLGDRQIIHYISTSSPRRTAVWKAWTEDGSQSVIVGTNLAAWLPSVTNSLTILIDPTQESYQEWEGVRYSCRNILDTRKNFFGENIIFLAHSPDTPDLSKVGSLPQLQFWPTIIDRTTEEPTTRRNFISSHIIDKISDFQRILFFVPHLREATHAVCKDCGALFTAEMIEHSPQCTNCHGSRFSLIGYGAETVVNELRAQTVISSEDTAILLDAAKFKELDQLQFSPDKKTVVIATTPLYTRLPLQSFDLIIDLSADFELLHPTFQSEELLWKRLRGTAVQFSDSWIGSWFVQTRKPDLLAWRVRDFAGYTIWWAKERDLRKRFNQAPFDILK